jgi:hypothetical protein
VSASFVFRLDGRGPWNGNTLYEISGFELTSAADALAMYAKLRDATAIEIPLTRRGKPVTFAITIR